MTEITCPECGDSAEDSNEKPYCSDGCAEENLDDGFDAERVRAGHRRKLKAREQEIENALYEAEDENGEVRVVLGDDESPGDE